MVRVKRAVRKRMPRPFCPGTEVIIDKRSSHRIIAKEMEKQSRGPAPRRSPLPLMLWHSSPVSRSYMPVRSSHQEELARKPTQVPEISSQTMEEDCIIVEDLPETPAKEQLPPSPTKPGNVTSTISASQEKELSPYSFQKLRADLEKARWPYFGMIECAQDYINRMNSFGILLE